VNNNTLGAQRAFAPKAIGLKLALTAAAIAATGGFSPAVAAEQTGISNRSIGYVLTTRTYGIYQAMDATGKETNAECPKGLYDFGPREQFAAMGSAVLDEGIVSGHTQAAAGIDRLGAACIVEADDAELGIRCWVASSNWEPRLEGFIGGFRHLRMWRRCRR
jgi:hypothetical protein